MATVYGTNNSETLNSLDGVTNGADTIYGYGGNDSIFGWGGNDIIVGGSGADDINGGAGSDYSSYNDSTAGVTVNLSNGTGFGGYAEGDALTSIENVTGSWYDDFLIGNDSNNVLAGLGGHDTLKGGGGADTLYGDSGNDTLKGGGGADTLNGGSGVDTASYFDSSAGVFVSLYNDVAAFGDAEGDELNQIENLTGSAYHDDLWGSDGVNVLSGGGGDDSLKGYGGADTLNGGDGDDYLNGMTGNDSMNGGNGADTFIVDSSGDTVIDTSAGTFDIVRTSANYALGANADIESLRTTDDAGFGSIDLTGNASSQEIRGNAGNNMLAGGLGNDILTGLIGEDAFIFNTALGAGNVDAITDYSVAQDQIRLDNATFTNLFATEGNWLTADEFRIGAAAADANDRIVYNSATGALFYDADGSGAGAAVQFASLTTGLALTSNEFFIV
jgi:Ca2+-binding RTX toxin-like protein